LLLERVIFPTLPPYRGQASINSFLWGWGKRRGLVWCLEDVPLPTLTHPQRPCLLKSLNKDGEINISPPKKRGKEEIIPPKKGVGWGKKGLKPFLKGGGREKIKQGVGQKRRAKKGAKKGFSPHKFSGGYSLSALLVNFTFGGPESDFQGG